MYKVVMSSKDDSVVVVQTGRYYHVEQVSVNGGIYKHPNMTCEEAIKLYRNIEKNK